MEYQRQEIIQTQLELQNQTKEFDEQKETLRVQRFENTFFKMLEVQQSIVNDLYAADSHKEKIEEDDPNNLGRLSKEVLAQDPRPHYQKDPHKVYGMPYEGLDVHFVVSDTTLTVQK